ncbi:hypothetical protein, partial [Stutzerimonas xanthomarina]|uniref:hypothetical protein n=1 Tax=Stutzerimonas xanthomarina TaxID=271420 RepID=UPI001C8CB623
GNKISNPPWVKFQSAGWVNFPSAPTTLDHRAKAGHLTALVRELRNPPHPESIVCLPSGGPYVHRRHRISPLNLLLAWSQRQVSAAPDINELDVPGWVPPACSIILWRKTSRIHCSTRLS